MAGMLANRVAIVTGGAKGIGYAVCQSLGKEGAKVVIGDVDQEASAAAVAQLEKQGIEAISTKCDVSSKAEVDALIQKAVDHMGGLVSAIMPTAATA